MACLEYEGDNAVFACGRQHLLTLFVGMRLMSAFLPRFPAGISISSRAYLSENDAGTR